MVPQKDQKDLNKILFSLDIGGRHKTNRVGPLGPLGPFRLFKARVRSRL